MSKLKLNKYSLAVRANAAENKLISLERYVIYDDIPLSQGNKLNFTDCYLYKVHKISE